MASGRGHPNQMCIPRNLNDNIKYGVLGDKFSRSKSWEVGECSNKLPTYTRVILVHINLDSPQFGVATATKKSGLIKTELHKM